MLLSWRPPANSLAARSWPGIGPSKVVLFGIAASIVAILVVVPLASLFRHVADQRLGGFWESVSSPEAVFSLQFAIAVAAAAALVNAVLGSGVAFMLARHDFPFKGLLDTLIALPGAVPGGVAGLTLLLLYGPLGILKGPFHGAGSRVVFVFGWVLIAHVLMTMHYVVRAMGSALREVDRSQEEAAMTMGANDAQVFLHVILPSVRTVLVSAVLFTFARSLGELGATILVSGMVSGQLALRTESAPAFIFHGFSRGDIGAASSMSVVLVVISVTVFFGLKLAAGITRKGRRTSVWRDIS